MRAEETAIILESRVHQRRKAIRVQAIGVGLVILLCLRNVYQHSVQCSGATNSYAIHSMGLAVGARDIAVPLMMKVADQKKRKPSSFVMPHAMCQ